MQSQHLLPLVRDVLEINRHRPKADPDTIVAFESIILGLKRMVEASSPQEDRSRDNVHLISLGRVQTNFHQELVRSGTLHVDNTFARLRDSTKIVFLGYRGGICNRLRAICSLAILAQSTGRTFSFTWAENRYCTGDISSCNIARCSISELLQYPQVEQVDTLVLDEPMAPSLIFKMFSGETEMKWGVFLRLYGELLRRVLDESLRRYQIAPDFIRQSLGLSAQSIGVHIRRTDFVQHFQEKYPSERLPSLEEYADLISESYGELPFYLSTDDLAVREFMAKRFPSLVRWNDTEFNCESFRQTSFSAVLTDLALLLRCGSLVLTPHSSFSDFVRQASSADVVFG